jgi:hypothetical protein
MDLLGPEPKLEGQLSRLKWFEPQAGGDVLLQDRIGIFLRDLLDLHAASRGSHEDRLGLSAIDHNAEIQLALDGERFLDQQTTHDAAIRPGLMRNQSHAEHLRSEVSGFLDRFRNLHSAALAASAGVDLRLHHHPASPGGEQALGSGFDFLSILRHLSPRHGDAIFLENCFRLILVNFHSASRTRGAPLRQKT